jgi:mRNA interferase MazF
VANLIDEAEAPEHANRIKAAPDIRNIYWCGLWTDAVKPEFWKRRPVIVVSYKNTLYGPCLVVPLTTLAQPGNKWTHKLTRNYVDPTVDAWVVCNHLLTVSPPGYLRSRAWCHGSPRTNLRLS